MGDARQPQSDTYLLARDNQASTRLSFQHFTLKSRQSWLLHPDVSVSLSKNPSPCIADLATGNGIWTIDLATELPHAQLIGFDISPAQFPSPAARPSNVHLEVLGLLDDVPEHYREAFDLVHIRLIVAAVWNMDKARLMANVLSMIKPGGFLQWEEVTDPMMLTVDRDLNVSTEMTSAAKAFYTIAPFQPGTEWCATLPEVFRDHGLVDVVRHAPPVNPATLMLETQANVWVIEESFQFAVAAGKAGVREQMDIVRKDIDRMRREGQFLAYSWLVAAGRKPDGIEGWVDSVP